MNDKIFLLSAEEYNKYRHLIPDIGDIGWWLRTPGWNKIRAAFVSVDHVYEPGEYIDNGKKAVRPAIVIDTQGINPGDKMQIGEYTLIALDKNLAIFESPIAFRSFDSRDDHTNYYMNSQIREFLLHWVKIIEEV